MIESAAVRDAMLELDERIVANDVDSFDRLVADDPVTMTMSSGSSGGSDR